MTAPASDIPVPPPDHDIHARTRLLIGDEGLARLGSARVTDLFRTQNCPLARHLRRRLRNLGIGEGIPAVHSPVLPHRNQGAEPEEDFYQRGRARTPLGSISYLPVLFGCIMAGWVVQHLLGEAPSLD
jgi:tRNA A37 threonylcarbamoyladenosine dehydratase